MKYKELMKVAKKNDYNIEKGVMQTIITSPGMYGSINRIAISEINIESISINARLTYSGDFEMLTSALAYAETPIEERRPEKKYYLKHSFMCGFEKDTFLNVDDLNRAVYLGSNAQSSSIQTQFTQAEIEDIKEKYKTTLDDFEQIEVEE